MRLQIDPTTTLLPLVQQAEPDEDYDFETHLKDGIAAAQAGERETARMLLSLAADADPHSEDVWMWLASISEYPEELLAFLNNVLAINPSNQKAAEWQLATRAVLAKTLVQRGVDAHENGAGDQARTFFEQALGHDQNCEVAWIWLAAIAEDSDVRRQHLHRVLAINPANTAARQALEDIVKADVASRLDNAKRAAVEGRTAEAISAIDEILVEHSDNTQAWLLRSHFATDLNEKLTSLERVLELEPENAAARASYEFLVSTVQVTRDENNGHHPVEASTESEEERSAEEMPSSNVSDLPGPSEGSVGEAATPAQYEVACEDAVAAAPLDHPAEAPAPDAEAQVSDNLEYTGSFGYTAAPSPEALENAIHITDEAPFVDDADKDHVRAGAPAFEASTSDAVSAAPVHTCPYCYYESSHGGFECGGCHAVLTLSDIEALLSNNNAKVEVIRDAVTGMEAAWNMHELDADQLTTIAVGQFNLGEAEAGLAYLQEALRRDPNNVILGGQINTITIRLNEIRQQNELHEAMPQGRSILVIDDSATVRKLISGKLEKSGHSVVCAADGVEGLERLAEQMPDLVLLDIGMPRMDGYEVCRQIRANAAAKDLPVVMISGKDGFFDKVRGRMAGCTGYVTKPFGPETLMKALEVYLAPDRSANGRSAEAAATGAPVTDELSLNM